LGALKEPQGIGYVPSTDTLYVANGGDGSVRLYAGGDLTPAGQIALGRDADNVRVDDAARRVFVGYGSGALAVIDAVSRKKIADIGLRQHPESFQLDAAGHIFVNVPDAQEIAVVDRAANRQGTSWATGSLRANYPLALDLSRSRVLAAFRHPPKVGVFDLRDGRLLSSLDTCGDADDLFLDAKRNRLYLSCGEGFVDVLETRGDSYVRIDRMSTASGARTAFFTPELDRLMLAVRASKDVPAAVWVYRPSP
jgi:DNA-binding beta-propeller fold protein YncE